VIDTLGRHGIMVVLDNHHSRGDWCCDEAHGDGL
jgi:endoglucanase